MVNTIMNKVIDGKYSDKYNLSRCRVVRRLLFIAAQLPRIRRVRRPHEVSMCYIDCGCHLFECPYVTETGSHSLGVHAPPKVRPSLQVSMRHTKSDHYCRCPCVTYSQTIIVGVHALQRGRHPLGCPCVTGSEATSVNGHALPNVKPPLGCPCAT